MLNSGRVETQVLFGTGNVHVRSERQGFAVVAGFLLGQHIGMVSNGVRQPLQASGTFCDRRLRPGGKSALGRGHGLVHFRRARTGDGPEDLSGAWRHIFKDLRRVLERTIDKIQYLHD